MYKSVKLIFSLLIVSIVTCCSSNGNESTKLDDAKQDVDSLTIRTQQLAEIGDMMVEISSILDSIKTQDEILLTMQDIEKTPKGINRNELIKKVRAIKLKIEEQRARIYQLQSLIASKDSLSRDYHNLRIIVDELTKEVERKNQVITDLQDELSKKNSDISRLTKSLESLQATNASQQHVIEAQEQGLTNQANMINKAYYILGDKKTLKEKGITNKKGVFSKTKVNQDGIDNSAFTEVNMRDFRTITIQSTKAKVMSSHPTNSYKIVVDNVSATSNLNIIDASQFWSITKYLIIQY